MEQKKLSRLANELTDFCLANGIFNFSDGAKEIKQRIEELLDDVVFVEGLINIIVDKANYQQDINADKLIELLSELERIKLELEHKTSEKAGAKC